MPPPGTAMQEDSWHAIRIAGDVVVERVAVAHGEHAAVVALDLGVELPRVLGRVRGLVRGVRREAWRRSAGRLSSTWLWLTLLIGGVGARLLLVRRVTACSARGSMQGLIS